MKFFLIITFLVFNLSADALEAKSLKYSADIIPKNMSVKQKKERFLYLLVPPINKVYNELYAQFIKIQQDIKAKTNQVEIARLKTIYKVKSDEALLLALKPHPQSIALAQAAMESAWATSRFFIEANNVFGMWSSNKNEKRIAAGEKRGGTRTIWLRKFDSIEDCIREYYKMMGRGKTYKKFREYRYETNDVFTIIKGLDKYSEIGEKYVQELGSMIRYNKLTKYDKIQ